jgi:hypothetical protein
VISIDHHIWQMNKISKVRPLRRAAQKGLLRRLRRRYKFRGIKGVTTEDSPCRWPNSWVKVSCSAPHPPDFTYGVQKGGVYPLGGVYHHLKFKLDSTVHPWLHYRNEGDRQCSITLDRRTRANLRAEYSG